MSGPSQRRGRRARTAPYRVPGEQAVRELLRAAPERVDRILVERGRSFESLEALAARAGLSLEVCEPLALREQAAGVPCRGILALARPPVLHDLGDLLKHLLAAGEGRRRVLVALDGVQDPQNLGAIVRSCDFFGVRGVFWPRDRAVGLTPAVVRASAGATERMPMAEVTNLARGLATCRDAGGWVLGTVPQGGESLPELVLRDRLPEPLIVVLGGEHEGMRRLTRERCDLLATIPSGGGVASLNVAAAAAVTLSWVTATPAD